MSSDFLTREQLLSELLARPSLRQVAATCVLPAIRVGGEWLYRRSDFEAWLARQQSVSGETATSR